MMYNALCIYTAVMLTLILVLKVLIWRRER